MIVLFVGGIAFLLVPILAMALGMVCNPNPPRDGTAGPWCRECRYALAGLADGVACPECGGLERMTRASGAEKIWRWVVVVMVASVASSLPVWVMWLRERMGLESVPFVLAVMVAGVAMEMTSIALFASRVKGRLLLAGAIVLVGTQSLGNLAGSIAILLRPVHEEKSVACVLVPVLGILCAAVVFDAFAVGAGIWVWMRRRG